MRAKFRFALLGAIMLPTCAGAAPAYTVTASIAGPDGAWDYASVDGTQLYIARSDAVTVVDLPTGAVSSLGRVQRGHAVVPLPDGHLLVTSGNDGTARLFDPAAKTELASIAVGKKPDAALLDGARTHALVVNAVSGTVSVIDLATAKVVRTIAVKPALEFGALAADGALFINNEDASEIDPVDLARGTADAPIAMPGCKAPTGLGYDRTHDRLIAACDNGVAAVVNVKTRKLAALISIGEGPDAVIVDEARGLAFIPCGENGVLDVLSLSGGKVTHVATVKTEIGARTGAVDPRTGAIYLPTAAFGAKTAGAKRPAMVPGTFHILVVKPSS